MFASLDLFVGHLRSEVSEKQDRADPSDISVRQTWPSSTC